MHWVVQASLQNTHRKRILENRISLSWGKKDSLNEENFNFWGGLALIWRGGFERYLLRQALRRGKKVDLRSPLPKEKRGKGLSEGGENSNKACPSDRCMWRKSKMGKAAAASGTTEKKKKGFHASTKEGGGGRKKVAPVPSPRNASRKGKKEKRRGAQRKQVRATLTSDFRRGQRGSLTNWGGGGGKR